MSRDLGILALAALAALAAGPIERARADVVSGPPGACPVGTDGVGCHWPACVPDECTSDADCDPGERCETRSLCVWDRTCGGGWSPTPTRDANAACPTGGGCDADHTCRALSVCVPGARAGDAGGASDGGSERRHARWDCGCAVGRGSPPLAAGLLAAALAIVLARRRRARA